MTREVQAGYADFLAAIRNCRHPEHDSWIGWTGGKFDPKAIDLEKINQLLRNFQQQVGKR